jgi:hypothetical protein
LNAGTSDEHLSLLEHMAPVHGRVRAVLVTTPQAVALLDALKCLSFARTVALPVLGLIENMSGYVCPCCGEISAVFSTGGGADMARRESLPFLGALPVDTDLVSLLDAAEELTLAEERGGSETPTVAEGAAPPHAVFDLQRRYQQTSSAKLFKPIVDHIIAALLDPPVAV